MWSCTANEAGTGNKRHGRDTMLAHAAGSAPRHGLAVHINAKHSTRLAANRADDRGGLTPGPAAARAPLRFQNLRWGHADPWDIAIDHLLSVLLRN